MLSWLLGERALGQFTYAVNWSSTPALGVTTPGAFDVIRLSCGNNIYACTSKLHIYSACMQLVIAYYHSEFLLQNQLLLLVPAPVLQLHLSQMEMVGNCELVWPAVSRLAVYG